MDDAFKIFIDRLRKGQQQPIDEELPPAFLDVEEKELCFREGVSIHGVAYLAEDSLVLHFNAKTNATIPCSICSEQIKVPVLVEDVYHVEPLEDIKGSVFNMKEAVRTAVLLEVPHYVECNKGNCPQRKVISKYINQEPSEDSNEDSTGSEKRSERGQHPFADL